MKKRQITPVLSDFYKKKLKQCYGNVLVYLTKNCHEVNQCHNKGVVYESNRKRVFSRSFWRRRS